MWKRRRPTDAEFGAELKAHLDLEADRLARDGMTEEDAQTEAHRRFGSVAAAQERFYESGRVMWVDQLRQDIRYALRGFRRNPTFALVAVVTLALGIGANTAIFSVVNAVLLRPLPYEGADRLVDIAGAMPYPGVTQAEIAAIEERSHTLSHIGVYFPIPTTMTLTGRGEPVRIDGIQVTPSILPMVGARPLFGRVFQPREDTAGARSVILSHAAWQRYFGSDRDIVGRSIGLNGTGYMVIGVMPATFQFPDSRALFWIPLVWPPQVARLIPSARLRDGASVEDATAEINRIVGDVRESNAAGAPPPPPLPLPPNAPKGFRLTRLQDLLVAPVRPALLVIAAAVAFVLLIACVNVANLVLARTVSRQREFGIRRALGAGRGRLVRQAFTESLVLALAGGLLGFALAIGGIALLRTLGADLPRRDTGLGVAIPRFDEIGIDWNVLAFTMVTSIVTGLVFGLVPAMRQSSTGHMDALRESAGTGASGFSVFRRNRVQGLLVVAEVGLAMILLVGGGLLIRSFVKLSRVDPGYNPANVLTFRIGWPRPRYPATLPEDLTARVRALPGVRSAGYAQILPMVYQNSTATLSTAPTPPNQMPPPPPPPSATAIRPPQFPDARMVSRDYLDVMSIPVVTGRGFEEKDDAGAPRVMLINRSLARSGFLGSNPVGSQIYAFGPAPWQIVGIVEDTRQFLDMPPGPQVYFDLRQLARPTTPGPGPQRPLPYFAVRIDGASDATIANIRAVVRQFDAEATLENVAMMQDLVSNSVNRPRLYAVLLGVFAGAAVALAAIGIYGVIAYSITQRTREIGVRIALGARRAQVLQLVLGQGLALTALGLVLGIAAAAVVTRYMDRMLFGLTPLDPTTFVFASAIFIAVAMLAAFLPARRATKVDPLIALRCE